MADKQQPELTPEQAEIRRLKRKLVWRTVFFVFALLAIGGGVGWWINQTYARMQRTEAMAAGQKKMISELEQQGQNLSIEKATTEDMGRIMDQLTSNLKQLNDEKKRMRDSLTLMGRQFNYTLKAANLKGRFAEARAQITTVSKDSLQMTLRCAVPAAAKLAEVGKVGYTVLSTDTRLKAEEVAATTPLNGFQVTLPNLKSVDLLQVRFYKKVTNELLHEQLYPL